VKRGGLKAGTAQGGRQSGAQRRACVCVETGSPPRTAPARPDSQTRRPPSTPQAGAAGSEGTRPARNTHTQRVRVCTHALCSLSLLFPTLTFVWNWTLGGLNG